MGAQALDTFDLFDAGDASLSAALLTQKSLVDTQERLGAMLEVMPIGLLIHTEQGILFANQEACELLQAEKHELVGQHLLDRIAHDDATKIAMQLRCSFSGEQRTAPLEVLVDRHDGTQRLVKIVAGSLPWEGTPVVQILLQDVTDQKRAENSLRQLTITDELTGAYNRRHLLYEAALYLGSESVASVSVSVVILDIDHFKRINDGHGHAVGDLALKALTRLMNALVPTLRSNSAIFARIGGEEFVILLPGFELAAACGVAERARRAIEKLKVDYPDGTLSFTVSMGVAQYCAADGTFEETLRRADEALYCAKSAGRNVVRAAPHPRDPSASIPE